MVTHVVHILPGEDLIFALHRYCKKHHIELAYLATASLELKQAVLKKGYEQTLFTLEGPFDVISIEGMVSEHALSINVGISDQNFKALGGKVGVGTIVLNNGHVVLVDISETNLQDEKPHLTSLKEIELGNVTKACKQK